MQFQSNSGGQTRTVDLSVAPNSRFSLVYPKPSVLYSWFPTELLHYVEKAMYEILEEIALTNL